MKLNKQIYDKENNLTTNIDLQSPNIWTLLNKDNMSNALAISIVILAVTFAYLGINQSTKSRVFDYSEKVKVGTYDKP